MNALTKPADAALAAIAGELNISLAPPGATLATMRALDDVRREIVAQSEHAVSVIRKQLGDYTPPALGFERPQGHAGDRARLDAAVAELRAQVTRYGRIVLDLAALV